MDYRPLISMMAAAAGGGSAPSPKSLVWACGMECAVAPLGTASSPHWSNNPTGVTFPTTTVRSGNRAMRVNLAAQSSIIVSSYTPVAGHNVYRLYILFATLPSAATFLVRFEGAPILGLAYRSTDSKLYCATGGSITPSSFGASGFTVTTGVWYRVDLDLNNVAGAHTLDAEIAVDGAAGTAIGQKTSTAASLYSSATWLGSSASVTGEWFLDDMAVSQTAADYPIGDGYVHAFVPVADGTHNTGAAGSFRVGAAGANITNATTDSYQYIDETPIDTATATVDDYVTQTTDTGGGSEYVEYILGPATGSSAPTVGPRGVEVAYGNHSPSTGTGTHELKISDNGTEATVRSWNSATGTNTVVSARNHFTVAPSNGLAWHAANDGSDGDFRDLRVRFGYSTDGNPNQSLDYVLVEAEFAG